MLVFVGWFLLVVGCCCCCCCWLLLVVVVVFVVGCWLLFVVVCDDWLFVVSFDNCVGRTCLIIESTFC